MKSKKRITGTGRGAQLIREATKALEVSRWKAFTPDELSRIKNALAKNVYSQTDSDLLHEVENYIIWRGL